jgi:hypothetical protein
MDGYLCKPMRAQELDAVLEDIAERRDNLENVDSGAVRKN